MLIVYKRFKTMKSLKFNFSPAEFLRRFGLTKIYYWFNK